MKAAQINAYGGSEVVKINKDTPRPAAEAGTILVEVRAAGVNPVDWKLREGYMQQMAPLQFPATLGGDFSGVVAEVGPGVSSLKRGDEVYGTAIIVGGGSGSFAEFASAKSNSVAPKPKSVSYLEAAALPLAGVSALQALTEHIQLAAGQKILIHGGAGGIGSLAIQLAKHLGAHVATTVRADDADYVKSLGVDEVIDHENQFLEEVAGDYDAVFDTVGGETYARSFAVLKKSGIIVSMLEQPSEALMERYGVKARAQFTKVNIERLSKLAEFVDQGVLKVNVDKVFPLDQAGPALAYLQNGTVRGKVVVQIRRG